VLHRALDTSNGVGTHEVDEVGEPADIAAMAAFLLSDKASWVSGQIWHVDGGISSLRV
jgi:NAD(P)-dependent dehydrogenase (short-subunit alcohol dehydrogenase family)